MSNNDKILELDSIRRHKVSEVICVKCLHQWIDVRPEGVPLKNLECGFCREIGFVIETGEDIE